eukprot:2291426-Pleurochrysis_carterae.AAC.1
MTSRTSRPPWRASSGSASWSRCARRATPLRPSSPPTSGPSPPTRSSSSSTLSRAPTPRWPTRTCAEVADTYLLPSGRHTAHLTTAAAWTVSSRCAIWNLCLTSAARPALMYPTMYRCTC